MPVGHTKVCVGLRHRAPLRLVTVQQLRRSCTIKDSSQLPCQVVCILLGTTWLDGVVDCKIQFGYLGLGFRLVLDLICTGNAGQNHMVLCAMTNGSACTLIYIWHEVQDPIPADSGV